MSRYSNLINTLRKYQEVVESAYLLEHSKCSSGYRQKADALDDFEVMNRVVTRTIMEFEEDQRFERQKLEVEEVFQSFKERMKNEESK